MTRWRALGIVGAWLLLSVSLAATNARPQVFVIGGIVAVASIAILVILEFADSTVPVKWTRRRQMHRSRRGNDPRISSLRNQLHDARWFGSDELRDTLLGLVDDRLLAHHDIDRATDPSAAMAALSPTLRRLVGGPRRPVLAVRQLAHIVTDIEAL